MPIYEFECSACGNAFERLQKLSDPDPATCPACGKPQVRRRVSAPAFRLAGSGWYETDFKGKGEKKHNLATGDGPAAAADGKAAGDAAAKTGDARPAAAGEPGSKAPASAATPSVE
ncbi:FmdB family zinc ribbon protein [Dokdonella sp.]|uniref:FmdB family zinc ribbon protein n=1 Tax=Dokdonella sp. TaxID=2291710 RepID=UPI0031C88D71|nr:zinc ribbon domain-containing protein [Dokdonella sp.]